MNEVLDKTISLAIIAQLLILLVNDIRQIKADVSAIRDAITITKKTESKQKT